MKVYHTDKTNFNGVFLNKAVAGKYNQKKGRYENIGLSFVKLNPHDINDIKTLESITKSWMYDTFSINIYNDALDVYNNKFKWKIFEETRNENTFYAPTSQENNFEHLDYRKILGICSARELAERDSHLLNLQVKPDYIYKMQSEYKGLGTAIITSLKNIYDKIELFSSKSKSVRDFYLKNGFVNIGDSLTKFLWKK